MKEETKENHGRIWKTTIKKKSCDSGQDIMETFVSLENKKH